MWFLSGAKVGVEKSFFIKNVKMDIGQFFWLICGYVVNMCAFGGASGTPLFSDVGLWPFQAPT